MVKTVSPKAKATPRKPIPKPGNPAAKTAAPQPPNTSQKVPKNSATTRRDMSLSIGSSRANEFIRYRLRSERSRTLVTGSDPEVTNAQLTGQYDRSNAIGWRDLAKKNLVSHR